MTERDKISDPRVQAVAEWMRDREENTTGWVNTRPDHQAYLLNQARDLLTSADRVDPIRIGLRKMQDTN